MKKITKIYIAVLVTIGVFSFSIPQNKLQAAVVCPVAAVCTPSTTGYCCGFGITNVTFNTINKNSGNASLGYEDFSCTEATTVNEGASYAISVSTPSPSAHNVRVWIDYDNNGSFNATTELAFSENSTTLASGSVNIPLGAVLSTPLRMRVSADFDGNAIPTPCSDLGFGQAEDYSVIIINPYSYIVCRWSRRAY